MYTRTLKWFFFPGGDTDKGGRSQDNGRRIGKRRKSREVESIANTSDPSQSENSKHATDGLYRPESPSIGIRRRAAASMERRRLSGVRSGSWRVKLRAKLTG